MTGFEPRIRESEATALPTEPQPLPRPTMVGPWNSLDKKESMACQIFPFNKS